MLFRSRFLDLKAALAQVERLQYDGAMAVDIGGESTRPGARDPISAAEEIRRVIPVATAILKEWPHLMVSVDTTKAAVAQAALEVGAAAINDTGGLRLDPGVAAQAASYSAGLILMHSRGSLENRADDALAVYPDGVAAAVVSELTESLAVATAMGVPSENLVIDPGLGFSKTPDQNLELLDEVGALTSLGKPIMVGPSRKRFLGVATGRDVADRDRAPAAACALAYEKGARIFRVHEPGAVIDALKVAAATLDYDQS